MADIFVDLHMVNKGPRVIDYPSYTYTPAIGDRVLTDIDEFFECIAVTGDTSGTDPLASAIDGNGHVVDGDVTWHYLCTQNYINLSEIEPSIGTEIPIDFTDGGANDYKITIWFWDKGSYYGGSVLAMAAINPNLPADRSQYLDFSVPGVNNKPGDFVGTWDLLHEGDSFVEMMKDEPLWPDASKGVVVGSSAIDRPFRACPDIFLATTMDRLQIVFDRRTNVPCRIKDLILHQADTWKNAAFKSWLTTYGSYFGRVYAENLLVIEEDESDNNIFNHARANQVWKNITFVSPSNRTYGRAQPFLFGSASGGTFDNIAFLGFGAIKLFSGTGTGYTLTNCYTDSTSILDTGMGTETDCSTGTIVIADQFIEPSSVATTPDFRTKTGAELIDNGTTGTAEDSFGTTRTSPDVGFFEYVSTGTTTELIYFGPDKPTDIYFGPDKVTAIYFGATKVYDK